MDYRGARRPARICVPFVYALFLGRPLGRSGEVDISEVVNSNVVSIGDYAFVGNTRITKVTIPSDVTYIGEGAFSGCSGMAELIFEGDADSGDLTIDYRAFYGCSSLESMQFGAYLQSIGNYAFRDCVSLETLETGSYVSSVGNYCFSGCTNLVTITFEKGLESIGTYCFRDCENLEYVYIPSTVSSVGTNAFQRCTFPVYVENTYNYAATYWNGWTTDYEGTVYYCSETRPDAFNSDGTGYDTDYWYFGEYGEPAVWEFPYTTYTAEAGGYVLCTKDAGSTAISYVCIFDEETEVFAVTECASETSGYTVALENGESYNVVLNDDTQSATVTAVTGD